MEGSEPADLDALFAAIQPRLVSYLRFKSGDNDPEDVVSDLYLQLRRTLGDDVSGIKNFDAYVFRALQRVLISKHVRSRRLKRYAVHESIDEMSEIAAVSPFANVEESLALEDALRKLAHKDSNLADVILLRFFGGMTTAELAVHLDKSPTWVKSASARAQRRLRSLLEVEGKPSRIVVAAEPSPIVEPGQLYALDIVGRELIRSLAQRPHLLRTLDWRTFERLLAGILEEFEYEVELTRGTKDGGIDIFAIKRAGPFGAHKYVLQAKRWTNMVGIEPVRELLFLRDQHKVTKACLATTSRFTRGALELAREYKWMLDLRDYDGLIEWLAACSSGGKML